MLKIDIVLSVCALMHSIGIVHIHCKPVTMLNNRNVRSSGCVLTFLIQKMRNCTNTGFVTSTCHLRMTGKGLLQARPKSTSNKKSGTKG